MSPPQAILVFNRLGLAEGPPVIKFVLGMAQRRTHMAPPPILIGIPAVRKGIPTSTRRLAETEHPPGRGADSELWRSGRLADGSAPACAVIGVPATALW